jgi:type IX secretion system PorP/SprF family membrane protein
MQYSQYLQNAFLINPAVGGAEPFADLRTGYSHQWAGFKGAPKGGYLSYCRGLYDPAKASVAEPLIDEVISLPTPGRGVAEPIRSKRDPNLGKPAPAREPNFHLGVGGTLFAESTGPLSISGIGGAFSSHIRIKDELKLSVGMGLEMLNYRLDSRMLDLVNNNDVAFADDVVNLLLPSINAGFSLYSRRWFLAGASRQLLRNRVQVNALNPVVSNLGVHYMVQAGYRFRVNDDINMTPSVIFRYISPAPPSFDLSLQANYRNQVFGGLSYRHKDAVVGMVGVGLSKTITAQYAFDFTTSNLRSYSAGTHSIVLGIKLGKNRLEGRRYFW